MSDLDRHTTPEPPSGAGSGGEHAGDRIDRYELREEIGQGGFGVVWRADQLGGWTRRSRSTSRCSTGAGACWARSIRTRWRRSLAHSITLAAAALGFVHGPGPPVEACIALSTAFVAAEIVRGRQGQAGLSERAPWIVAFTFGLLHGLGFASALRDVGLPSQAIPWARASATSA